MTAETVLRELEGMRALARALAGGDADDLLQDAAVAALEHPPEAAPPRAWLAVVLRNRRRMDARAAARRVAREQAIDVDEPEAPEAALDRARAFERLGAALVALEEPFRATVIARYLDGKSAAEIAREHDVPAGTVRWRLKEGLDRLRAALDDSQPKWKLAFAPLLASAKTGVLMKAKTSILVVLILLLVGAAVLFVVNRRDQHGGKATTQNAQPRGRDAAIAIAPKPTEPAVEPLPGQGKAIIDSASGPGSVAGRIINWSTGDGVDGADVTFTSDGAATTVRSRANGVFELAPPEPGHFVLTAISAPGFLPYAPELLHSSVHVEVMKDRAVRGITVFLFPAVDYEGRVVDAKGAAVAGAKVRLVGTPANEQAIEKLETEWRTDNDGRFVFHAVDDAVFEAVKNNLRGWGIVNGDVALTHKMTIAIGAAPARDAKITGHVIDGAGKPLANVLVSGSPDDPPGKDRVRAVSYATTDADGAFALEDLDRESYDLYAQLDGFAPTVIEHVTGGTKDLNITLQLGEPLSGKVVDDRGAAIGAYTLLVFRRQGTALDLKGARSIVDATGHFEVRMPPGEYELQAHATGWAPSEPVEAKTGAAPVQLTVTQGATLAGKVVSAENGDPIPYARVTREGRGGGASVQPANAGTVTRADGTFELTGIPPGTFSITIGAGNHHPRIEGGLTAADGDKLGPLTIPLAKLKEGETPQLELVGIGVKLAGQKDDFLLVDGVIPGGGAEAAGIVAGDQIVAVDGIAVTKLRLDGAVSKIRGAEGTSVSVTLRREGKLVPLVVTRKKLRA